MTAKLWFPRAVVGGVWLVMTLGLLAYVGHYGSNVPFFDDWHLVPIITGDDPLTLQWLWSQHGDHRVPLSRLLLLGLLKLSGYDFRCGMVFDVLALSAASLTLIFLSQRLRGRLSFADAFFPLALLNPGQWEMYLWCWCISVVLPIFLALFELAIMAWWGVRPSSRATFAAGLLMLSLPLADPAGLAFVPAIILWLTTVGIIAWRKRSASSRAQRFLPFLFAGAGIILLGVVHIGFTRADHGETHPTIQAALRTIVQVLSMSIGHAAVLIWPLSALIVLGLLVGSVYVVSRTWIEQAADRSRVAGVLFFFAGACCLVVALGWSRAGEGDDAGFKSRYVIMAIPVLCSVFVSWGLYRGNLGSAVQGAMCTLMVLLLPLNIKTALDSANNFRPHLAGFEQDLRDGKPASLLAERHTNILRPWPVDAPDKRYVHERLLMLQRAGIGPYRQMAPDVALREIVIVYDPAQPIHLGRPQTVAAIRIQYACDDEKAGPIGLTVSYKLGEAASFSPAEVVPVPPNFLLGLQRERTALAWVNQRIDHIQIEPEEPRTVTILAVVLLVEDR